MEIKALKEQFEKNRNIRDRALLRFSGVPGMDVYNCSLPFIWEGNRYLFGRTEKHDEWANSRVCLFRETGVHIQLPKNTVGFLKSKSGLNVKYGITSEGVIDAGYTGSIMVKLYNHSDNTYRVRKGDKISQLVILPCLLPELEAVDSLEDTERGTGGFGSSGFSMYAGF